MKRMLLAVCLGVLLVFLVASNWYEYRWLIVPNVLTGVGFGSPLGAWEPVSVTPLGADKGEVIMVLRKARLALP